MVVVKIGTYYGHFSRIYRSNLSIYLQNYMKNGLIFKTTNQKCFFFNTVHNLITFSIVFTNKNRGGGYFWLPQHLFFFFFFFFFSIISFLPFFYIFLYWSVWWSEWPLVGGGGGGGLKVPPLFLFVKTIEKVIRLCTVLKKR